MHSLQLLKKMYATILKLNSLQVQVDTRQMCFYKREWRSENVPFLHQTMNHSISHFAPAYHRVSAKAFQSALGKKIT